MGEIVLSDNAGTQGTKSDGVWVQDGDTVTVRYVNADGNAIDTDTMTADGVKPSILNITPANGAVLDVSNPTLRFDVVDEGSKMDLSNLVSNDPAVEKNITVEIHGIQVSGGSFQGVPERISFIYATGNKWTDDAADGGYDVADSVEFAITITATDVAGNKAEVTVDEDGESVHKIRIDQTEPTASSAETGTGWNRSKAEETSNDDTAVSVTFSEDIDSASVSASDFTVAGVRPSAAVVGTTDDDADTTADERTTHRVYLTVAALAPDAKPEVVVTGQVMDLGGNALDTSLDEATLTATDGLDPSITVSVDTELAVKDDDVTVTIDSEERLSTADGVTEISINGPRSSGSANQRRRFLIGKAKTPTQYEGSATVKATFGSGNVRRVRAGEGYVQDEREQPT